LWFCAITGVYIFALVAMREVLFPDSQWLVLWQYVPVGLVCLITNLLFLQYRPGLIREEPFYEVRQMGREGIPRADEKIDVPADVERQLQMLMKERNIYREMGLTIGQLADMLELPEYRLRRIINAGLGYRNFNDYLNSFRIQEAGQRLADPSQVEEAVLNIALDSGFRSLSSFNKAFREAYGVTPTRYRQQKLALEE
jgi:AraC-like DNA-binding protein